MNDEDHQLSSEKCMCSSCTKVYEAIETLKNHYSSLVRGLIKVKNAETIGSKIDCLGAILNSIIGPDVEKISTIVIDADEHLIVFNLEIIGQTSVMPKSEKNEIN